MTGNQSETDGITDRNRRAGVDRRTVLKTLGCLGVAAGTAGKAGATGALSTAAASPTEVETRFTPDDVAAFDRFGVVALDGDRALVGAPGDDHGDNDASGAAYVFERSGESWTQQDKLTADDRAEATGFGNAVALDGDTAVVASNEGVAGEVDVFVRSGGDWTRQAVLVPEDVDVADGVGSAVAVDGDTVVVGAAGDDTADYEQSLVGSAYVFERSNGNWTERTKLTADDSQPGDLFGAELAVDGDTLLVGAPATENLVGGGTVYVFERSGGGWSRRTDLVAGDDDRNNEFGSAVALDGDTAVVGSRSGKDDGVVVGAAYVFERADGSWTRQRRLDPDDADNRDRFGQSVAVAGDAAVVGADGDDEHNGPLSGAAYVFERANGSWTRGAKLVAADGDEEDLFGGVVALDRATVLVGASGRQEPDPRSGQDAGTVYVHELPGGTNTPPTADAGADRTVTPGATVELDATGSADPDGDTLSYSWSQTAGTSVDLRGATTATPSFTAPDVGSTTELAFEVTVSDGAADATDAVTVTVVPPGEADGPVVGGSAAPAKDPNGDGIFEDVNGDGDVTPGDATVLFDAVFDGDPAVTDNPGMFDLNGDGSVTPGDATVLFNRIFGG